MQASLLEILREIPDHRRAEGKRFDLATVLLYAVIAMVAGANSYRQPSASNCVIRRPTPGCA
jgi:hypothetical protein